MITQTSFGSGFVNRAAALLRDSRAARDNRVKGGANAAPNPNQPKTAEASGEMQGPDVAKGNQAAKNPAANDANPTNNAEYRKAMMEYFKENNLRPPQF